MYKIVKFSEQKARVAWIRLQLRITISPAVQVMQGPLSYSWFSLMFWQNEPPSFKQVRAKNNKIFIVHFEYQPVIIIFQFSKYDKYKVIKNWFSSDSEVAVSKFSSLTISIFETVQFFFQIKIPDSKKMPDCRSVGRSSQRCQIRISNKHKTDFRSLIFYDFLYTSCLMNRSFAGCSRRVFQTVISEISRIILKW